MTYIYMYFHMLMGNYSPHQLVVQGTCSPGMPRTELGGGGEDGE